MPVEKDRRLIQCARAPAAMKLPYSRVKHRHRPEVPTAAHVEEIHNGWFYIRQKGQ